MSQVHISNHAHTVTVTHDGADLAYVIEKAQKLYEDTRPPERPAGPAVATRNRSAGALARPGSHMGEGAQPAVKP